MTPLEQANRQDWVRRLMETTTVSQEDLDVDEPVAGWAWLPRREGKKTTRVVHGTVLNSFVVALGGWQSVEIVPGSVIDVFHDPRVVVHVAPRPGAGGTSQSHGRLITYLARGETAEEKFRRLALRWKTERGPVSSVARMAMHPAYQQMVGMGPVAIPFLLRELEREPDHWFAALHAITGEDPVPVDSRGKIKEMAAAWLKWGQEHGFAG